jgi:CheY-like chemotaxis protein
LQEDNPINQRLGFKVLQKLNYDTSMAKNGQEAVEMIQSGSPDIVLMDLSMASHFEGAVTSSMFLAARYGRLRSNTGDSAA